MNTAHQTLLAVQHSFSQPTSSTGIILAMSSPTNRDPDPDNQQLPPTDPDVQNEFDVDAEMEDQTQGDTSATAQNTSSATLDHEMGSTQQQDLDGSGATSSLPQQNRKDVTLREFLSKMDDYAPIVSLNIPSIRSTDKLYSHTDLITLRYLF